MTKPKFDPLLDEIPPPAVATALAALHHANANADQQKLAADWILSHACRAFSSTFNIDPHVSSFLQGRRQAGLIIMNAMRTSANAAKAIEDLNKESENG